MNILSTLENKSLPLQNINSKFCEPLPTSDEIDASEHFVQFYEKDSLLVEAVSDFLGSRLEAGECVLMIVTPPHLHDIEENLQKRGLDLSAIRMDGRYNTLGAAETLALFMQEGLPDAVRFYETVGRIVVQSGKDDCKLSAFGEMTALLWTEGNYHGALRMEELWTDLISVHAFSLFCAYPLDLMGEEAQEAFFKDMHSHNTRIIPHASHVALSTRDERLGEISRLQRKSAALEAEIARRKEIEKALAIREHELADFLENAMEGIHQVGPEGIIIWANLAELKMLGYTLDEYIGHSITEFHVDADVIADILTKLIHGDSLANYPARLRCKDGSIKLVRIHSNAYFTGGQFKHTRCFTRDVTALQETEILHQRLAAIIDSSDDAIISKTLDGIITSWNGAAARIFGYSAKEAIGQSKTILFPADRLHEEAEILKRLRSGERITSFESVRVRKDGTHLNVSLTISPIRDSNNVIVGASTIARDITSQKHLEQQLLQSQKMEGLGRMAGGIAHDFNNLLTIISGYAELIEDQLPIDSEVVLDVKKVQHASARAADLVAQLLLFARPQDRLSTVFAPDVFIVNMSQLLKSLIGDNIEFVTILNDNVGNISMDPNQLEQVLINLVVNARDAMSGGGKLVLSVQNVRFTEIHIEQHLRIEPGDYVRLTIADSGTGMTDTVQIRLFEPFFTTKGQGKGTGLGLSTCYGIITRAGGAIGLVSQVGIGSTFNIYLPMTEIPLNAVSQEIKAAPDFRGSETILVVDDEPLVRTLASNILRRNGYQVIEAGNGEEALRVIEDCSVPISLVISDVVMPLMGGLELKRRLRDILPSAEVLMVSGYSEDYSDEPELSSDQAHFLQKPFTANTLLARIKEILHNPS